jgi:hypothetical protein
LTLSFIAIFSLVMAAYVLAACCIQYFELSDQLYHDQVRDMEIVEGLLYFTVDGRLQLHEEYHSRLQDRLLEDRYMEVMDPNGNVLFRNDRLTGQVLGGEGYKLRGRSA